MSALPIRTPLRLRVASDRPWTITEPCPVTVIQSPCRQMPGHVRSRCRGIASRPGRSTSQRHRGHRAGDDELADLVRDRLAVRVPGLHRHAQAGQDSSPAVIGSVGAKPANALTTSVPPDIETSGIRGPNWSEHPDVGVRGQRGPGGADQPQPARSRGGLTPAARSLKVSRAGPQERHAVTAASGHSWSGAGDAGLPS